MSASIEFTEELSDEARAVFTEEAVRFLTELCERFAARRGTLLEARREWQARIDAGALPGFREDSREVREGDWTVRSLPKPLLDRRVEITGPADPKMTINALNADVRVFMADFEDALSPTWANVVSGQRAMKAAAERTLEFTNEAGKHYALGDDPAILLARVRGLHLDEKHVTYGGERVPGALVDFGLYYHHNHAQLAKIGHGPWFYVPKLEHYEEARWWNEVFTFAEQRYGQDIGTIKATMLIETLPAVFEMDEILYELRDHAAALNCGRWDYIFSYIKTLRNHPDRMLPDRGAVSMDKPFLDAYSRLLIDTCHKRGALAMGGMSAFIPRRDEAENARVLEKVRADKQLEADNGHDGSWVAHPGLADTVWKVYSDAFEDGKTNQLHVRPDVSDIDEALLVQPCEGPFTMEGLRTNIRVAVQYIEAWLGGAGAVAIYGLMEDAATAEISRASIWQWIHHGAKLGTGEAVDEALFTRVIGEELMIVQGEVGEARWAEGRFGEAADLMRELCLQDEFAEFLTLGAYERL
jgi:malate synthase